MNLFRRQWLVLFLLLWFPASLWTWVAQPSLPALAQAQAKPVAGADRVECSALSSTTLGREVRYCALLPAAYDTQRRRRFPVLYWLHGLGQNEQALVGTGGWTLVEELRKRGELGEFILITPEGGQSFYLNSRDGRNQYEDFFIREFLPAMEHRFRIEAARATRGISGVSMGGFGALHFGLKYPKLFGSVSAHSAALMEEPPAALTNGGGMGFMNRVFGHPVDRAFWERSSVFSVARKAATSEDWKIYFDCGDQDDYAFDQGNGTLDRLLTARGIPHEYHLYPGGHSWTYFARHMPASLEFHARIFAAAREEKR